MFKIEKIREIEKSVKSKNRKIHEIKKSRNIFLLDAEFFEKKIENSEIF